MVSVRFALGEYATDEDAGTMSVNLVAIGLNELNCGGPVDVTVVLANRDFDATPFDISLGKPLSEIDLVQRSSFLPLSCRRRRLHFGFGWSVQRSFRSHLPTKR